MPPGLTSLTLTIGLTGIVVVMLAGILWLWPRLAGQGYARFLQRVAALVTVQAALLSLTFVLINRAGGFYSSWSDLLGLYTGGGTLHSLASAGPSPAAGLAAGPADPVRPTRRRQPAGSLAAIRIHGQLSGITLSGDVYLPPGYRPRARNGPRYPVVVAFPGPAAGPDSPYAPARLAATVAGQIAAGRLQPVIVVMLPSGPRRDPGCLNVPGGPQAQLFFTQDVPAALDAAYRTGAAPFGWALLAGPPGGYCALQLALTGAGAFAAAALPPARFTVPPGPPVTAGNPLLRAEDDLMWLLRHRPMQPVSVLLTASSPSNPVLALARPPMTASALPGLGAALDWLGRHLNAGDVDA